MNCMNDSLKKIIRLIEKTGNTCVIINENGDPKFVLMNLNDFERLVDQNADIKDLSEEELLEKINRYIAMWRAGREEEAALEWELEEIPGKVKRDNEKTVFRQEEKSEETFYFEPLD